MRIPIILALLIAGCGAAEKPPADPGGLVPIAAVGGPEVGFPNLAADAEGPLMVWTEPAGDGHRLPVARLRDGVWETVGVVAEGSDWFVNWADVPSVEVAGDGTLWAHWMARLGEGTYAYGVQVAHSDDGGRSWSEPSWLHDDRSPVEHGFAALVAAGDGMQAVWLDGRQWVEGREVMTVRARALDGNGFGPETLIDASTCDCCPNAAAPLPGGGAVMAYRNRTADEVRDIFVTRLVDGRWEEPVPVHDDGWRIAACPVNGAALATRGSRVALAWFTAPDDQPRVNLSFSDDGGASFTEPIRVDDGNPLGRVDVEWLDEATAVVSWIEASLEEDQAGILLRRVTTDGLAGPSVAVVPTSRSRAAGYPRILATDEGLLLAWRAIGEGIRSGLVPTG